MNRQSASPLSAELHLLPRPDSWPPSLIGFPATLPLLIGRENEVRAVRDLLHQPACRLLTITGPGGIGKTRLALAVAAEVAGEFRDGAVFIPLEAVHDPASVVPAIALALGVREAPGRLLRDVLNTALRGREQLLVLDNFEHVVQAAPDVARLLESGLGLTVLVTSRIPLRVQAEQRYLTPPLGMPETAHATCDALLRHDAIALFSERARRVRPDFRLTPDNAADIVALCQNLEGIPLAIELAAAWSHVLPPGALRARLSQRLDVLSGGPADQPSRLQSMRDAIAWSYDLLTADEQQLFRRLGIFIGGFHLQSAEYVCALTPSSTGTQRVDDSASLLPMIARLVEASLVQQVVADSREPRFMLLETVREFALEQLRARGEYDRVAHRHAQWMLDLVETTEPHLLGPEETDAQDTIRIELGNLRGALSWANLRDPGVGVRIAGLLWVFWIYQGLLGEGFHWISAALATDEGTGQHRANAMVTAAALALMQADTERAAPLVRQATALVETINDPILRARLGFVHGVTTLYQGQFAEAGRELGQAVVAYDAGTSSTDRTMRAWTRAGQGVSVAGAGDLVSAATLYEQAREDVAQSGSLLVEALILCDFSGLLLDIGDTTRAREMMTEVLRIATEFDRIGHLGEVWLVSQALFVLAAVDVIENNPSRAAIRVGAAEAIMSRLGIIFTPPLQARADQTLLQLSVDLRSDLARQLREQGRTHLSDVIAGIVRGHDSLVTDASAREIGPLAPLSARERQILRQIADGRSDREIAEALFISRKTASNHVTNILRKLGVRTRAAAVAHALRESQTSE